ncbi:MAG: T9SS type A sorting domain-containing protein [Candidatus Kapabacteria bacterium]|nr:T9SS type A sorting domain-containing protein [Ignavibacteriota bacterium]MCW5885587.1 T9SS type A sorting domain-containing protein [Candidatus Kapabacteria bacterium]
MKFYINFLILILFFPYFSKSQAELDKVWEVNCKVKNLSYLNLINYSIDNKKIRLLIDGQPPKLLLKNPAIIDIDFNGNLLKNISTVMSKTAKPYFVSDLNNEHHYFTKYDGKINILVTDEDGDSLSFVPFDLPSNYYATSNPIYYNESIIQYVSDFETLDGYLYYFDKFFNKKFEIKLEKPKSELYLYPYPRLKIDSANFDLFTLFYGPTLYLDGSVDHLVLVKYDTLGKIKWETDIQLPNNKRIFYQDYKIEADNIFILYYVKEDKDKYFSILKLNNNGEIITNIPLYDDLTNHFWLRTKFISNDRIAYWGYNVSADPLEVSINFLKILNINGDILNKYEWQSFHTIIGLFETHLSNLIILTSRIDTLSVMEIKLSTVSVHDYNYFADNTQISIHPNPASDFITIQLRNKGLQPFAADRVQIFDMLGLEVISTPSASQPPTGEGNLRIDVSHLPTGVYFVQIIGSNGACSIVKKFVKM